MKEIIRDALERHRRVAEDLAASFVEPIEKAAGRIVQCYRSGCKVLVMGNGGSAADAQHFAAELVGRYVRERSALPAIALTTDTSILTAVANDYGYNDVFRRQVEAHANPGDVVVGISTSGNSENVCRALETARARGATTIALGGGDGGRMKALADLSLIVPVKETARVQEAHITIIHILCDIVERGMTEHDAGQT
jgi:D-sedoheptulose 7-phosphate isomerase